MITQDSDGNKVVTIDLPETSVQLNIVGDLAIRQLRWNTLEQQWEGNLVLIPKELIDIFVNIVCDVAGVM